MKSTNYECFLDQVIGTAILLFGVFLCTDRENELVSKDSVPSIVGLLLIAINAGYGFTC